MPKVLIREFDNSTTGLLSENNFAVVVPGYFGEHVGDESEILIDHEVYELKSQADFEKYIGKHVSAAVEGVAPRLQEINSEAADARKDIDKYFRAVTPSDFDGYIGTTPLYVYRATKLAGTNAKHGKNGHNLVTLEHGTGASKITETYTLTKINKPSEITWSTTSTESTTSNYCIIAEGDDGVTEIQEKHVGNQMAYELLGLGYKVLFKRINPDLPIDEQLNGDAFWAPLRDKSIFNFRYVTTGGWYNASAMNKICNLAKFNSDDAQVETAEILGDTNGRGDCIALCDLDESGIASNLTIDDLVTKLGNAAKAISQANQYAAIFGPRVTYVMADDEDFGNNKTFPASFHYLACAARTFERYNEWYAVAGYNRGVSSYAIDYTSVKLGEIAINTLAPRISNTYTNKSINLILHERGNYYLWGNRTAYALDGRGIVFNHFLNIRQLCTTIKKQLYTACKQFTFDPNSDLLWINFVNAIKPTLEAMRADQGIKGYKITKVANDKKALLTARIRIVPIEAVEDFDISIYLEDSLTGIIINANEEQA